MNPVMVLYLQMFLKPCSVCVQFNAYITEVTIQNHSCPTIWNYMAKLPTFEFQGYCCHNISIAILGSKEAKETKHEVDFIS